MSDFRSRLDEEFEQLKDRQQKLHSFFGTDAFNRLSKHQQSLLIIQEAAMLTYKQCLSERLMLLDGSNPPGGPGTPP